MRRYPAGSPPAPRRLRPASLLLLAGASCAPVAALAQTVSPPIAEYQERARSSFQLSNGTLFPLNVVLEVRGFRVTEQGEVVDAPLDPSKVRVKLSTMSFRLPPRATHTVFYEASADSTPAWFNIVSAMTGARTETGLNVRILLPHVVYLNQKQHLAREDVALRAVQYDSAGGRVRIQLENLGPRLGRVLLVSAGRDGAAAEPGAGFPLFPYSRRWTELRWTDSLPPQRLALRFAKFTIDSVVR